MAVCLVVLVMAFSSLLTAAHCLYQTFQGVTISYTRTSATGVVTNGSQQTGQNSTSFNPPTPEGFPDLENDIGLVRLPARFASDPLLQIAELPLLSSVQGQQGVVASTISHTSTLPPGKDAVLRGTINEGPKTLTIKSATSAVCSGDAAPGLSFRQGAGTLSLASSPKRLTYPRVIVRARCS